MAGSDKLSLERAVAKFVYNNFYHIIEAYGQWHQYGRRLIRVHFTAKAAQRSSPSWRA